jgi:hypothetical protein
MSSDADAAAPGGRGSFRFPLTLKLNIQKLAPKTPTERRELIETHDLTPFHLA